MLKRYHFIELIPHVHAGGPPKSERLVELSNGCICCTLREDLLTQVTELALDGNFDHLLIESTGISEPLPVAQTFLFEDMKTGRWWVAERCTKTF